MYNRSVRVILRTFVIVLALSILALPSSALASIAYGSINNFDTVNDTGGECHGFEIEIDDIHSKDITYTYDWNHYGVPKITEDNTDPLHPKVFVRYESKKNPDGTWAAYTAVPAGPLAPTDGHQCTNPSVNFGCEHFGVGFYGAPTAVKYNWLKDDGAGHLIYGGAVNISTPTFVYFPPAPAVPAQVQAAIVPPPPPAPPVLQFGVASWVKDTKTKTHNNNKVELRDLVSDDPNDANDRNWKNGEPDEVETEWRLLQTDFNAGDGGANGELEGVPEDLPNGDEVITRRYDFYKYVGPIDAESGEAMADTVGPDGIHGVGSVTYNSYIDPDTGEWVEETVDLSTIVVVGDYIGAQMAGFDPAGQIGLIDHLQDGEVNVPYIDRTVVVGGTPPIVTTRTGALPDGMTFDVVTGVLYGTPTLSGTFTFTIHSTDANAGDVTNIYNLTILDAAVVEPLHITVTTIASPAAGGITSGGGEYVIGTNVTVAATANPGFAFVSWTDGGTMVSSLPSYQFTADVNREVVANFVQTYVVTTSASPNDGGTTSGGGTFNSGDSVTAVAVANAGYDFVNWTEGGAVVSSSASYAFTVGANRDLIANFAPIMADADEDGIADAIDNCLNTPNPDQADTDNDGIGDACDNCVSIANPDQNDGNNNGVGDACEELIINNLVTFAPLNTTFTYTSNTSGCPAGYVGKYSFTARLTNTSSNLLSGLAVKVATLTNNNLLQNADGGPAGVGAILTVPNLNGYSDDSLSTGEYVDIPLVLCLKQKKGFSFYVDVWGIAQ